MKEFEIHDNRSVRINGSSLPGSWFYYAMNQFENFNRVRCPFCDNGFIAEEGRLFGIFKSPYPTIVAVLWILVLLIAIPILTKFYLKE